MNYPQTLNKAKTLLRQRTGKRDGRPLPGGYSALVEEGAADVQLRLHLKAGSEIDVNLIDPNVKESVQQFNREAEVRVA